jgi:hypothetical protein
MAKAARALLVVPGPKLTSNDYFQGGRDMLGIRRYALKGEAMGILTLLKTYFERQLKNGEVELPEVRLAGQTQRKRNRVTYSQNMYINS